MTPDRMLTALTPWLEAELGVSLQVAGADPVPVFAASVRASGERSLWALKLGDRAIVTVRPDWLDAVRSVVTGLNVEQLFSVFGAYELARVTLPQGAGVWGASWMFVADPERFRPARDERPVPMTLVQLNAEVDAELFWHCFPKHAQVGFGIRDGAELVALAAVQELTHGVWEIGFDVLPQRKRGGLGRAVMTAAAEWILARDGIALATTAPWNVPSARTQRSLGMRHFATDMQGVMGRFHVPPSPLGSPFAGAEVYHYYPDWAMNQDIRPRDS